MWDICGAETLPVSTQRCLLKTRLVVLTGHWLRRLQAKCEAFIAARFNELKFCECMEELSRDTWMRLMYISSYKDQGGKEMMLHRQAPAICGRPSWHAADCVFSRWEARPAALTRHLGSDLGLHILTCCSACTCTSG